MFSLSEVSLVKFGCKVCGEDLCNESLSDESRGIAIFLVLLVIFIAVAAAVVIKLVKPSALRKHGRWLAAAGPAPHRFFGRCGAVAGQETNRCALRVCVGTRRSGHT